MAFIQDIIDRATRQLGRVFLRNPGDTANMGDAANPVYVAGFASLENLNGLLQDIHYDASATIAGGQANKWLVAVQYTIPASYRLDISAFSAKSDDNRCTAQVVHRDAVFGSLALSTNVFTDGSAISAPVFASHLYAVITTTVGANNRTLTVTYTNQDGTTGRTATGSVDANTPAGYIIDLTLQAGDYGVRDVTAASLDVTVAGAVDIVGIHILWEQRMNTADQTYYNTLPRSSVVFTAGKTLMMNVMSNAGATSRRQISTLGALIPT